MSNTVWSADKGWHDGPQVTVTLEHGRITTKKMTEELSHLIMVDGEPVSSCCRALIERTCDYTDTHVFFVEEAETDEAGKIVTATYTFHKTYDGTDGENVRYACHECGREIEQDDIDWQEG